MNLTKQIEEISDKAFSIIRGKLNESNGIIVITAISELFDEENDDELRDDCGLLTCDINEQDDYDGWDDFYILKIVGNNTNCTIHTITENHIEKEFDLFDLSQLNRAIIADFLTPQEILPQEEKFPNGFDSWQEAHYEVVCHVTTTADFPFTMAYQVRAERGSGGLYELAEELTTAFEKEFEGRVWDGEYFDTISDWLEKKDRNHRQKIADEWNNKSIPVINRTIQTLELANEFITVLNNWIPGDMAEVIKRNSENLADSCCATHDFCDANMAMDEAFKKVMNREFIFWDDDKPETEELHRADTELINKAWALAKSNNFKLSEDE